MQKSHRSCWISGQRGFGYTLHINTTSTALADFHTLNGLWIGTYRAAMVLQRAIRAAVGEGRTP